MEDIKARRSHSASLTPTEGSKFKFSPDACSSVGRLRDVSNFFYPVNHTRRSFTPSRNAFYMNSPDISPINPTFEFSFKRMPPEKIRKVKADTTISSTDDSTVSEDFMLMPPPPRRKPAGSGSHSANIETNARQRRLEPAYPVYGSNGRKIVRKVQKKSQQQQQQHQHQHVSSQNDILNVPVSLNSLLLDTGLDRYIRAFEREEIDLEVFLVMDDSDLIRIGIESATDRAAILKFKDIFYMNDS